METMQLKLFREVIVESDSSAIKSFQLFEYFLLANITLVMQVFFLWSFSSQIMFPRICFPAKKA